MIRRDSIERETRHFRIENDLATDDAEDPGPRGRARDRLSNRGARLFPARLEGGESKPDALRVGIEMSVGVIEAGDHEPTLKIYTLGSRAGEPLDLGRGPNGDDAIPADDDAFGGGRPRIRREDSSIHQHQVRPIVGPAGKSDETADSENDRRSGWGRREPNHG